MLILLTQGSWDRSKELLQSLLGTEGAQRLRHPESDVVRGWDWWSLCGWWVEKNLKLKAKCYSFLDQEGHLSKRKSSSLP